jgi:hypothetical protein
MATKSKSRKRKSKPKATEEFRPRVKTSTRIAAFVAIVAVFALLAGMIAMGSAGM